MAVQKLQSSDLNTHARIFNDKYRHTFHFQEMLFHRNNILSGLLYHYYVHTIYFWLQSQAVRLEF